MRDIGGPGGHHLVWGGPQRGYLDNGNYYLPQHTYSAIASIFKARFTFFHFSFHEQAFTEPEWDTGLISRLLIIFYLSYSKALSNWSILASSEMTNHVKLFLQPNSPLWNNCHFPQFCALFGHIDRNWG